jgi:hypothetical protein
MSGHTFSKRMRNSELSKGLIAVSLLVFLTGVVLAVGTEGTSQKVGVLLWAVGTAMGGLQSRLARRQHR